jgi:hypothetical protein
MFSSFLPHRSSGRGRREGREEESGGKSLVLYLFEDLVSPSRLIRRSEKESHMEEEDDRVE